VEHHSSPSPLAGEPMHPAPRKRGRLQEATNVSTVIARSESDEAIQSGTSRLDCFAELVIGPATSGRTRWLAMTSPLFTPRFRQIKEAERRQVQCFVTPCQRARRRATDKSACANPSAVGRARLPAFHHGSRQRESPPQGSASGQASRNTTSDGGGHSANAAPGCSDAPRMPVIVPAGMMPEPPESKADEAPPAGTALAPFRPASPGRRPFRARFDSQRNVTEIVTIVNKSVTVDYPPLEWPGARMISL
jgi:hypothetical protein